MDINKLIDTLNGLNYEKDMKTFVKNYEMLYESIIKIDKVLNEKEDTNEYIHLSLEDLLILLDNMDEKNTDIEYIKINKNIINAIETKMTELNYKNVN
jgi:hypothetical protein